MKGGAFSCGIVGAGVFSQRGGGIFGFGGLLLRGGGLLYNWKTVKNVVVQAGKLRMQPTRKPKRRQSQP